MSVRKVTNRGGNIIGKFPSFKMKRAIQFESTLERDYLYLPRHEHRQEGVALPGPFVTVRRRLPKARVGQEDTEPDEQGRAGGDKDSPVADNRSDLPCGN
jgi:hypothetical protein